MRVIGVLDLANGRAVHAVAGRRREYRAVRSGLAPAPGDAVAIARAYRDALALREVYVADLDAIAGGAPQRALVREVVRAAAPAAVLVDAGGCSAEQARLTLADGAARVVVGLETLPDMADLAPLVRDVGGERVVFSLDLRGGVPVVRAGAAVQPDPLAVAERAADAGVTSILVLDLARVGTGLGVDLALVRRIRRACPAVAVLVGGGVRDRAELERLADAGVDGALVATALHDGRLTAADVEALGAARRSG
ncbi:MAG TPA: HisA/HisF-related TIM barrel protein [Gemmatimonadaceae bacterium]|nr:HisA/HisF-related TIM barrel protein [Gemmatimonadaceae bacterium]